MVCPSLNSWGRDVISPRSTTMSYYIIFVLVTKREECNKMERRYEPKPSPLHPFFLAGEEVHDDQFRSLSLCPTYNMHYTFVLFTNV